MSNPTKTIIMSIGFFIIGGIIFLVYVFLTMWNIFYSGKKQREENYPNLKDMKKKEEK